MMKKPDIVTLELNEKTDRIATTVECPSCQDKYLYGVPYVQVPCHKCGISYKTQFSQDIYTKKARQINSLLAWHDGVKFEATEPYERDLTNMKDHFTRMANWDLSDITQSEQSFRFCISCGLCLNCFRCDSCQHIFPRDKSRRKQQCPKCRSNSFKRTHFTEAKDLENKKGCPHCDSDKIKMTLTTQKTKCHKCGTNKLTAEKKNVLYSLTITRKRGYQKANV